LLARGLAALMGPRRDIPIKSLTVGAC